MEAVVGHFDGVFGIGVFGLRGVEGDGGILRVGVVVIFARLRVFEAFVMDEVGDGEVFFVIEVDDLPMLMPADLDNGVGYLFEGLTVFFFIGAPGVVFGVVDVYEIGSRHGGDENDGCLAIEGMQFVQDDAEAAVDGAVACVFRVVVPCAEAMAMPPVVGAEEDGEDVAGGDLEFVPVVGEVGGGPAVVSLVDIMDIGELFDYVCEIAFGHAVLGFVGVVVEIGDAVTDGYPG